MANYTDAEKAAIVERFHQGAKSAALCEEFSISRSTLYRWASVYCTANPGSNRTFTIREYDMLCRKLKMAEQIIEILKVVNCTAHAPLKERLSELEKLYGQYDVHTLCEALDVDRGTFYNYILRGKKGNAWYDKRREEFRVLIREVFDAYHQVVGAEKIRTILVQRGYRVSAAYIASLMQEMGLISVRSISKRDYLSACEPKPKQNILQQQFSASRPNQVWVSDVTCFKLKGNYFYICVIIDLFSRKVIAWKISKKNSTQLITSTFRAAVEQRRPEEGLIFHSDRGSQYTSHRFQQLLRESKVSQSFSNSGRPHDNAVAESFFATLKREELYRKDYTSEIDFRKSIDEYIQFYNSRRPHRTLKNLTPDQKEDNYARNA